MQTLDDFSTTLQSARSAQGVKVKDLAAATGLSPLAVRNILSGTAAPRLTNAMALAQELGFELVLVPAAAARSLAHSPQGPRTVVSDLERSLGVAPGTPDA